MVGCGLWVVVVCCLFAVCCLFVSFSFCCLSLLVEAKTAALQRLITVLSDLRIWVNVLQVVLKVFCFSKLPFLIREIEKKFFFFST